MQQARAVVSQLLAQQRIAEQDIDAALLVSGVYPSKASWHAFVLRGLHWLGMLAFALAVIFFVAANWGELGKLLRFGLLECLLVSSVAAYCYFPSHGLVAKSLLLLAFLLLGGLLALFGQTYQTGADPWQLFFNWALLGTPWVLIARFAPLWMLWLVVLNLAISAYHKDFAGWFSSWMSPQESVSWALLLFNSAALLGWELLARRFSWLRNSWASRLLAAWCIFLLSLLAGFAIFDHDMTLATNVVWLPGMAILLWVYRLKKLDVLILTLWCLSAIVVLICWAAQSFFNIEQAGSLLMLTIILISMASAAAIWLKKLTGEHA